MQRLYIYIYIYILFFPTYFGHFWQWRLGLMCTFWRVGKTCVYYITAKSKKYRVWRRLRWRNHVAVNKIIVCLRCAHKLTGFVNFLNNKHYRIKMCHRGSNIFSCFTGHTYSEMSSLIMSMDAKVQFHVFSPSAVDGVGCPQPRRDHFTHGKEPRYALYRRLGRPHCWSGRKLRRLNLLYPPGFESQTVQLISSRYTVYLLGIHELNF